MIDWDDDDEYGTFLNVFLWKAIFGKKIQKFEQVTETKNKDGDFELLFYFEDGSQLRIVGVADCCSSTWIEHIDFPEVLQDAELLELEEITGGNVVLDEDTELQTYFLKIRTSKGYCTIDFRNSSNGYYGTDLQYTYKKNN
jgi:hypothetical protein